MVTVSVPCQALCRITQAGRTLLFVGDKRKHKNVSHGCGDIGLKGILRNWIVTCSAVIILKINILPENVNNKYFKLFISILQLEVQNWIFFLDFHIEAE